MTNSKRWWFPIPALAALLALAPFSVRADDAPAAVAASCSVSIRQQPETAVTADLWDVARRARDLRTCGAVAPADVLIVFDLDNTLLAMESNLGSDQWYVLQDELIKAWMKAHPSPTQAPVPTTCRPVVAKHEPAFCAPLLNESLEVKPLQLDDTQRRFSPGPDLGAAQATLYRVLPMRLTQPDACEVVGRLQDVGYACIALTSRGPVNADATTRELARNGISFASSAIETHGLVEGAEFTWSCTDLEALSPEDVARCDGEGKIARSTLWKDGILMTSGAHKGAALRLLLSKAVHKPSHVLFVDDTLRHSLGMRRAFASQPDVSVHTFWYTREHDRVRAFYASPLAISATYAEWEAAADWRRWVSWPGPKELSGAAR